MYYSSESTNKNEIQQFFLVGVWGKKNNKSEGINFYI